MLEVPDNPLLAPWYRVVGDGERLLLEFAQSLVVLEGAAVRTLLPALLPLLDGRRTVAEIVDRLGVPARPAIEAALKLLAERGVVIAGPDAPVAVRAPARALAAAHGIGPEAAGQRLRAASIALVGEGPMTLDVARLLGEAGIGTIRRGVWAGRTGADLTVVVPAADELDRLEAWNRAAIRSRRTWMLLRPHDGRFTGVGPIVVPGQTSCYACLLLRRGANSGYSEDIGEIEAAPVAASSEAGLDALAAALAAHLAVRWAAAHDTTLPGVLFTLESRPTPRIEEHYVLRVPRCPVCATALQTAPRLPWHEAVAA